MKSFLLYLTIVGIPLAGLFGILHAGNRLEAPPSIGGSWRLDAPSPPGAIDISQSGVHLSVEMDGVRMRGEIRGDSLIALTPPTENTSRACGPDLGRELRASIDRTADPHRLTGTVGTPGGADCPRTAVSAVRVPAEKRGGGH
jgi:hypothetical protein